MNTLHLRCNRLPRGWWCSRRFNHDGPCAARPRWWMRIWTLIRSSYIEQSNDGMIGDFESFPEWCPDIDEGGIPTSYIVRPRAESTAAEALHYVTDRWDIPKIGAKFPGKPGMIVRSHSARMTGNGSYRVSIDLFRIVDYRADSRRRWARFPICR